MSESSRISVWLAIDIDLSHSVQFIFCATPAQIQLMNLTTLINNSHPSIHEKENDNPNGNNYQHLDKKDKNQKHSPNTTLSPHSQKSASIEEYPQPHSPEENTKEKTLGREREAARWTHEIEEEHEAIQEEQPQQQQQTRIQEEEKEYIKEQKEQLEKIEPQEHQNSKDVSLDQLLRNGRAVIKVMDRMEDGQYSKNRTHLIGWMRRECLNSKLQYATYANAVSLMDQYYKYCPLQKDTFVPTALCLIIISSKAIEPRVLFTSTVARINGFDLPQTLLLEKQLLAFFEFQVNAYNFARVAGEYMQRWDKLILKINHSNKDYCFLEEGLNNYLMSMELLFLCESQLRHRGSLFQPPLKLIFRAVLSKCPIINIDALIDEVFVLPNRETTQEMLFAFQVTDEEDAEVRISQWQKQFSAVIPTLTNKFSTYISEKQKYSCYGQFLCLLV